MRAVSEKLPEQVGVWTLTRKSGGQRRHARLLVIRCSCGHERTVVASEWRRRRVSQFCRRCLIEREQKRMAWLFA